VSYDQTWWDQDSSWWAKANRAKEHIDSLRRQVDDFRASEPYSLKPEPTEKPGRLAYRLRFLKPVPVAISTTVGDVLHNLRAALENLAFEVARRSQGGMLTATQEWASTFPIRETPEALDGFFASQAKKGLLYDRRARAALRSVQPFVNREDMHKHGVALDKGLRGGLPLERAAPPRHPVEHRQASATGPDGLVAGPHLLGQQRAYQPPRVPG
jgi:hypothetical protein